MAKLRDELPSEALIYSDDRFFKYLDLEVVKDFDGRKKRWPGPQKNVCHWWVLENGMAVGWNENPSRGWYFPVASKNVVKKVI